MRMYRRDFVAVAKVFRKEVIQIVEVTPPDAAVEFTDRFLAIQRMVEGMADIFEAENAQFDRKIFTEYALAVR